MSNIGNKEVMAKNLAFYLEKSGKTQRELADVVGVATSTFNDWMKGKKYPRIDKIEMLANYFGILKSDLIEDKPSQKKNDALADIIVRMRSDEDFFNLIMYIFKLSAKDFEKVKNVLHALLK